MNRPANASIPQAFRSRVTNGSAVLAGVDGNSAQARRYRDLLASLTAEAGPDLGEGDRLTIRNAASLVLLSEDLTAKMVRGEPVDPDAITRATNGANRALAALKRGRAPKKPSGQGALRDFLAARDEGRAA